MINTTRRSFVATSTTAAVALAMGMRPGLTAAKSDEAPIIDCHTHFYDPTRAQGTPPNGFPPRGDPVLYKPTYPDRFMEVAAPHGVKGTVVVEASIWPEDNDWVLNLVDEYPAIVGLVGNLVPGTEGFADQVKRLAKNKYFRGIRLRGPGNVKVGVGVATDSWIKDLRLLADHDLSLDLGDWSGPLDQVATLARRISDLRIIINHVAGVRVDGKTPDKAFLKDLKKVAKNRRVYCKISSLPENTRVRDGKAPTDPQYYKPTIDPFWDRFGEKRLIYGSNWPVCLHAASYETVFRIVDAYFTDKGRNVRRRFFSENAAKAYQWVKRGQ